MEMGEMQNFVRIMLKRQKEKIALLKREVRRLKRERRAYRTFYLKAMNRYCSLVRQKTKTAMSFLFDFLESHKAKYPVVCKDPGAIVEDEDSGIPKTTETSA